ncbi:hypothetical protein K438DRAFT_1960364 [Mycena galopus ATCC 62051]|nr:hypothetical protein K438DRAFT_1960364 [Mycena galopus ATCC 62051]
MFAELTPGPTSAGSLTQTQLCYNSPSAPWLRVLEYANGRTMRTSTTRYVTVSTRNFEKNFKGTVCIGHRGVMWRTCRNAFGLDPLLCLSRRPRPFRPLPGCTRLALSGVPLLHLLKRNSRRICPQSLCRTEMPQIRKPPISVPTDISLIRRNASLALIFKPTTTRYTQSMFCKQSNVSGSRLPIPASHAPCGGPPTAQSSSNRRTQTNTLTHRARTPDAVDPRQLTVPTLLSLVTHCTSTSDILPAAYCACRRPSPTAQFVYALPARGNDAPILCTAPPAGVQLRPARCAGYGTGLNILL